jgi:hypothetical protein
MQISTTLSALTVLAAAACGDGGGGGGDGDECERRLETRVIYTGAHTGLDYSGYLQEFDADGRVVGSGTSAVNPHSGEGTELGGSESCLGPETEHDTPGGKLEAWIDLDGDDSSRCAGALLPSGAPPPCQPEPGDPHGVITYTLRSHGTTTAELEFGDP